MAAHAAAPSETAVAETAVAETAVAETAEVVDLAFPGPDDLASVAHGPVVSADVPSDPDLAVEPLPSSWTLVRVSPGDDPPSNPLGFEPLLFDDDVAEALALLLRDGGLGVDAEVELDAPATIALAVPRVELEALDLDLTPTPANTVLEEADLLDLDGAESHADLEPGFELGDATSDAAEIPLEPSAPPETVAVEAPGAPSAEGAFEIAASGPSPEAEPAPAIPVPATDTGDVHAAFVKALVDVALAAGATRAAATIPSLLDGTGGVHGLSPELGEALVAAKVLERSGDTMRPRDAFAATAEAWRRVLREETNDLTACGASTLDTWGAELLAALGVGRDGRTDVRRELRKRGVAAFGMRVAA